MDVYGILHIESNKVIGEYSSTREKYVYPYGDSNIFLHFKTNTEEYAQGYSLVDGDLIYDSNYSPPVNSYEHDMARKLKANTNFFLSMLVDFAAENSKIMNDLGYDSTQKALAVANARTEMTPIREAVMDMDYYSVWGLFDAVTRSNPLLTEERISKNKADLYAFIVG